MTLAHEDLLAVVRRLADRVAADRGCELVDIEMKRSRQGTLVRLFVDKVNGIGLDELQSVSEEVSALLDVEDPIEGTYTLEVSSPGLDRPLTTEADFRRSVGRLVRVTLAQPLDESQGLQVQGRLKAVEDGALAIERNKGGAVRVPLAQVNEGRLEVEWKRPQPEAARDLT
jgi:ribosome maturation factor RimP